MKRIFSMVLALVMVMTTFAMLVPNALAATEQNVEAKVLYEENFDDLNGKSPEEILAGANMTDERNGTPEFLSVQDGRLHYGESHTSDAYMILDDVAALGSAYNVEFDVRFIEGGSAYVGANKKQQVLSIFATDASDYSINAGYVGMVSQLFYNAKGANYSLSQSYYIKDNDSLSGLHNNAPVNTDAARLTAMKQALGLDAGATLENLGNRDMTVKIAVAANTLKTYIKTTGEYVQVSGTQGQPADRFTQDLRLMISEGTVVRIDNLTVKSADGATTIYTEDFNDIEANTVAGILAEIGWKVDNAKAANVRIENNALILTGPAASDSEELILVEDEAALNGYVVEYDVISNESERADSAVASIHSALGNYEARDGRQGWVSQVRFNRDVLSGREDGTGWGGAATSADIGTNNTQLLKPSFGGSNIAGLKLAVKAVFDPEAGTVTTYVQDITSSEKVAWTEAHKVSQSGILNDTDSEKAVWTKYIRLIMYFHLDVSIDNIKITALEKTPNVYGYQADTANSQNIRLLGVIDNEIFTTAEKVGFRVTMTKVNGGATATKDIDCNYVYKSVTEWGTGTPTTAAEMLHGASYIYALHVKGITEAVEITVVPYYVVGDVTYLGDACSTFTYDPTPAVQ